MSTHVREDFIPDLNLDVEKRDYTPVILQSLCLECRMWHQILKVVLILVSIDAESWAEPQLVLNPEDSFITPLSPPKGLWQTFAVHLNVLSSC